MLTLALSIPNVDVESESGDAVIVDSEVTDSDVFAVSSEGDVVVYGSIRKKCFEAAALAGNIDVSNSEFTNNQSLSFVADSMFRIRLIREW